MKNKIPGKVFWCLIVFVACGMIVHILHSEEKLLLSIDAVRQRGQEVIQEIEKELLEEEISLEKELGAISVGNLRKSASRHYAVEMRDRKSFDEKFAISDREIIQLQMSAIANDSVKVSREVIRAIARKSSPEGSDIAVSESFDGISLEINFDMSSMTTGEDGTSTKHQTIEALKSEVKLIVSRVANDVWQFCREFEIGSFFIGCRHYVGYVDEDGKDAGEENIVLYKVKVQIDQSVTLDSDPFIGLYSIARGLEVVEDSFGDIFLR